MNDQYPPPGGQPPYPQGAYPQYSPPQQADPDRPMPQDVGTASQLWWVVAALGFLQLLFALPVIWRDKDSFVDQLMDDPRITEMDGEFTRETAESLLMVGFGVVVVVALVFTALFVLFVHFMRRGKNWARIVLTFLGVMIAVQAVPVLFGIGTGDGDLGIVALGGVQILQAVAVVGAIVLMHRKDSSRYFLKFPPPSE